MLRTRIAALSAASTQEGGQRIEIEIATMTSAALDETASSAAIVMGHLRGAFGP